MAEFDLDFGEGNSGFSFDFGEGNSGFDLEVDGSTSIPIWGNIIGDMEDQTDLQAALDSKADVTALTEETATRASEDAALGSRISAAEGDIDSLEQDITALEGDIDGLQTALTAETTARASADTALRASLSAHEADTAVHITAEDRAYWNNKVRAYRNASGALVLTTAN